MTPAEVESLKAAFTTNTNWAEWSSLIVLAGLLIDIAAVFLYARDKPWGEIIFGLLGTGVIALGVYGEFRYSTKATDASVKLQKNSDNRIAELNWDAGKLANDAAQAKLEQEKLRADNLALEALIQPRQIPLDSGPNAKSAPLRDHKGTRVFIEIASGPCGCDPEARQLANQLTWVLPLVGWKPELIQGALPTNFMTEGVVIFARLVWPSLRERERETLRILHLPLGNS